MNAPRNLDRLLARSAERSAPVTVQLELTHRCNLDCTHCYLDVRHPGEELPTEAWLSVVDELAQGGTLFLNLTGGELFARRDALRIARHARSRGLAVTLLTSGTRLTAEDAREIAALKPVAVELSLYAARAAVHDAITRRPGSHRKTLRAAVRLRRLGVKVVLKCPILEANAEEVAGVQRLAERLAATWRFDPSVVVRRDGQRGPAALRPGRERLAKALTAPGLAGPGLTLRPPRHPDEPVCGVARRAALVGPNGDVFACGMHPAPAGNVRQGGFFAVWEGSPLLRALRQVRMRDLPVCGGCAKNDYCGRCGAMALIEHGDLLGPQQAACDRAAAKELAAGVVPRPSAAEGLRRRSVRLPVLP